MRREGWRRGKALTAFCVPRSHLRARAALQTASLERLALLLLDVVLVAHAEHHSFGVVRPAA